LLVRMLGEDGALIAPGAILHIAQQINDNRTTVTVD